MGGPPDLAAPGADGLCRARQPGAAGGAARLLRRARRAEEAGRAAECGALRILPVLQRRGSRDPEGRGPRLVREVPVDARQRRAGLVLQQDQDEALQLPKTILTLSLSKYEDAPSATGGS